jgi:ADP-heptose:LPS heptosyltransferase
LKSKYHKLYEILPTEAIIIVHPGTGGSAINLTVEQYAELVHNISQQIESFFIITSGPDEQEAAEKLSTLLTDVHHCIHYSTGSIIEFSKFISLSDLFISGSTGPLHIAGALNSPTAAFYPSRRSATSLRWQTLNEQSRRITFTAPQNNMAALDLLKASADITSLLQTTSQQS